MPAASDRAGMRPKGHRMTSDTIPSPGRPPRDTRALAETDHRRFYREIWGEDPPAADPAGRDGRGGAEEVSWRSEALMQTETLETQLGALYGAVQGLEREWGNELPQMIQEVWVQIGRLAQLLTKLQEELRRQE